MGVVVGRPHYMCMIDVVVWLEKVRGRCMRSCGGAEGSSGSFGNLLSGRGLKHPILSDRRPTRPRRSRRDSGFVQSPQRVSHSKTWYKPAAGDEYSGWQIPHEPPRHHPPRTRKDQTTDNRQLSLAAPSASRITSQTRRSEPLF